MENNLRSCKDCPSSFKLILPADIDYCIPKENPTSDDYMVRIYECEEQGHRNTIFWHRKPQQPKTDPILLSANEDDIMKPEPTEYSKSQGF